MFPEEKHADYVDFYDTAYCEYSEDQLEEIRKFLKDKPLDNPRYDDSGPADEFDVDDYLPF